MGRRSVDVKKQFIPHPMQLFLVGTYDRDHQVNMGMFCWLSFCWDEELCITVCMDGEKATKDNIKETGMFSACLVTEGLLPVANKIAASSGGRKQEILEEAAVHPGLALDVPVLSDSPYCYELSVKKVIPLAGSDLFVCRIADTTVPEEYIQNGVYSLTEMNPVLVSQKEYLKVTTKEECGLL